MLSKMLMANSSVSGVPISYVGANSALVGIPATSISINNVAGVQDGDSLYLFVTYFRASGTTSTAITNPTGWTVVYSNEDMFTGGYRLACCYRKTASSEGSSYTVSNGLGVSGIWSAGIVAFRDSSGFDTYTLSASVNSASATTTSATVSDSKSVALFVTHNVLANSTPLTVTYPSGWTEVVDASNNVSPNTQVGIAYRLNVPSGTLASQTATIAISAVNRSAYIIIKD